MTTQTTRTTEARNPEYYQWISKRLSPGMIPMGMSYEEFGSKRKMELEDLNMKASHLTAHSTMQEKNSLMAEIFDFLNCDYRNLDRTALETYEGRDRYRWFDGLIGRITGVTWETVKDDEEWSAEHGCSEEDMLAWALYFVVFTQ